MDRKQLTEYNVLKKKKIEITILYSIVLYLISHSKNVAIL